MAVGMCAPVHHEYPCVHPRVSLRTHVCPCAPTSIPVHPCVPQCHGCLHVSPGAVPESHSARCHSAPQRGHPGSRSPASHPHPPRPPPETHLRAKAPDATAYIGGAISPAEPQHVVGLQQGVMGCVKHQQGAITPREWRMGDGARKDAGVWVGGLGGGAIPRGGAQLASLSITTRPRMTNGPPACWALQTAAPGPLDPTMRCLVPHQPPDTQTSPGAHLDVVGLGELGALVEVALGPLDAVGAWVQELRAWGSSRCRWAHTPREDSPHPPEGWFGTDGAPGSQPAKAGCTPALRTHQPPPQGCSCCRAYPTDSS